MQQLIAVAANFVVGNAGGLAQIAAHLVTQIVIGIELFDILPAARNIAAAFEQVVIEHQLHHALVVPALNAIGIAIYALRGAQFQIGPQAGIFAARFGARGANAGYRRLERRIEPNLLG